MRSHRLLRLDDNKSAASCQQDLMQVDCQDFLSESLMQVVSTTYSKCAKLISSCIHSDFHRLGTA